MKVETFLEEELLIRKAVNALMNSLGSVETKRFLSLNNHKKRIESVKRHQERQINLEREKFLKEVLLVQ